MYTGEKSGTHYDSNLGSNYEETIVEPEQSTLVFEGDYSEHQYGAALKPGGKFQVYYSTKRLAVSEGAPLYAAVQFEDDANKFTKKELQDPLNGYYVTEFDIPEDAEKVIMWFYTYIYHYDSNFGANYHFELSS